MTSNIYIITNGKDFKVGFSKNPKRRLKQLQTGCPEVLELVYFLEIEHAPIRIIEKLMHYYFKDVKTHGEWFHAKIKDLKNNLEYVKMRYDNEETEKLFKLGLLNKEF